MDDGYSVCVQDTKMQMHTLINIQGVAGEPLHPGFKMPTSQI